MTADIRADQAERSLLGALMIDSSLLSTLGERVHESDFATTGNQRIFRAIGALYGAGKSADLVTVSAELDRTGEMFAVGGPTYLTGLLDNVPDVGNIGAYADLVRDAATRRELYRQSQRIAEAAQSRDAVSAIEEARTGLSKLNVQTGGSAQCVADTAGIVSHHVDRVLRAGGALLGVPSGFARLDDLTSGWQRSDLIIVAGRPGMGKTAFVCAAALNAALRGNRVLFFSLEMGAGALTSRLVCGLARVPLQSVRHGTLTAEERVSLMLSASLLRSARLWIDETSGLTVPDIRARVERMKQAGGIDLVCVDYIGLLGTRGRTENRTQEVSAFSRGLKAMAKDLSVPVIALSQLSREIERREDREPQLSDLRESGSIEQDSDIVIFLSRAGYYDQTAQRQHLADVIVAKHRNGPTGRLTVGWLGELTRFADLEKVEQ